MKLNDLVTWLDDYLQVKATPDSELALNGLQVECGRDIQRIAVAVDACQWVIDEAVSRQLDLIIVHHGLFWGGAEPLTGRAFRRLGALIHHDVGLYSSHLPLDRHPDVGNNGLLARLVGLTVAGFWGDYKGAPIGVWGDHIADRDTLGRALGSALGVTPQLLPCGPATTRRVGIVTGAGGSMIAEAHAAGIDTFITGEAKHHAFFAAEEFGVNVFLAGHYATETLGVKALGDQLSARFGIESTFIDHPTGL